MAHLPRCFSQCTQHHRWQQGVVCMKASPLHMIPRLRKPHSGRCHQRLARSYDWDLEAGEPQHESWRTTAGAAPTSSSIINEGEPSTAGTEDAASEDTLYADPVETALCVFACVLFDRGSFGGSYDTRMTYTGVRLTRLARLYAINMHGVSPTRGARNFKIPRLYSAPFTAPPIATFSAWVHEVAKQD